MIALTFFFFNHTCMECAAVLVSFSRLDCIFFLRADVEKKSYQSMLFKPPSFTDGLANI